ncbi:transcriptional regulator Myc-A-like isoform X2 [Macadamia integrifolia]|uniref:transcriptional regulator Myc-A-like isoform X2 n=1 Tax=Macadamia integrifolia TaxID=60698 RepID=UPI001C4FED40|nr:transcriptional regulator Myc-A-like isoform X2 [Macadamia integrifolia]
MSLVDYASSSEDNDAEIGEGEEEEEEEEEEEQRGGGREAKELEEEPLPSTVNFHNQRSISPSHQLPDSTTHLPAPSIEKLPDALLLLSSPALSSHQMSSTDHYSRVAAAMAESASRKREINGLASSYLRSKLPRGNLPHSKNVPDTVGGLLIPPQLSGRSNVVTEDISKLFAKGH